MKTLIFQSDNRERSCGDYPTYTSNINEIYAKKMGYDYSYHIVNPTWRHSSWLKIQVAIELIETTNYDKYIYLDTDCIINNHNLSIFEYLESAKYIRKDKNSHITFMNNKPWNFDMPCAGFYIFDRDNLKMFKNWWEIDLPEYNWKHYYEQKALFENINSFDINIIDDWMFEEKDINQYIRHIGSHESNIRLSFFKTKYESLI